MFWVLLAVLGAWHTITFDPATDADSYLVYWKTAPPVAWNPYWVNPPEVCPSSPCSVWLRDPSPGRVLYISVVGVNAAGEGPH